MRNMAAPVLSLAFVATGVAALREIALALTPADVCRIAAIEARYPVPARATVPETHGGQGVNVTIERVRRGYTEEQVGKRWSGNLLRVWAQVEARAEGR